MADLKWWTVAAGTLALTGVVAVAEIRVAACPVMEAPVCGVEQRHAELGPWAVSSYSGPVGPHAACPPVAAITVAAASW